MTQSELSSLTHLLAWDDPKRFHSDVAFLLILPKEGVAGERVYGLAMVWVHPYQARVSTIDDAVRKLTLLASARPNWSYTFCAVQQGCLSHASPERGSLGCHGRGDA